MNMGSNLPKVNNLSDTVETIDVFVHLSRVEEWIRASDEKATGLLTATTLLAAVIGLLLAEATKATSFPLQKSIIILLLLALVLSCVGGIFSILVLIPRLNFLVGIRRKKDKLNLKKDRVNLIGQGNPLNFIDVAKMSLLDLRSDWPSIRYQHDLLIEQYHVISRIALEKNKALARSGQILILSLVVVVTAGIFLGVAELTN
ncbi:DUF5706 domain-containing protein [Trichocoleus desertorum AS-A10]|uniref:hypothetical protein n=1 Tax=Trichocoleus desertorum TaxID=1481672 RepID=UPI003298950F